MLVRHGESLWNAEERLQGHGGTGLSPRGIAEAERTAVHLRARYPDVALVARSDLPRVEETAQPFVESFAGKVRLDERLREIDVGTWSGRTWPEVADQDPDTLAAWRAGQDVRRGGGETFAELRARVWAALTELAGSGETIVVFTHGGPIRVAVAAALELEPLGERRLAPVGNCSVTELLLRTDGALLAAYNRRDHLDGVAAHERQKKNPR